MRINPDFLGEQIKEANELEPGMKVLWLLDRTSRARHPFVRGDILEAIITSHGWANKKVSIKTRAGFMATVAYKSIYLDKREVYEKEEPTR